MRQARHLLILLAILLLITATATALPFAFLAPALYFFAALVVERFTPHRQDPRPQPQPFLTAVPLRAPPLP